MVKFKEKASEWFWKILAIGLILLWIGAKVQFWGIIYNAIFN